MELRRVDPRILKANAHNPRKIQPGELSDAALAASIKAVGILQPPAATEKNGELRLRHQARAASSRKRFGAGMSSIDRANFAIDLILECERALSRGNPRDRDPKR